MTPTEIIDLAHRITRSNLPLSRIAIQVSELEMAALKKHFDFSGMRLLDMKVISIPIVVAHDLQ